MQELEQGEKEKRKLGVRGGERGRECDEVKR